MDAAGWQTILLSNLGSQLVMDLHQAIHLWATKTELSECNYYGTNLENTIKTPLLDVF